MPPGAGTRAPRPSRSRSGHASSSAARVVHLGRAVGGHEVDRAAEARDERLALPRVEQVALGHALAAQLGRHLAERGHVPVEPREGVARALRESARRPHRCSDAAARVDRVHGEQLLQLEVRARRGPAFGPGRQRLRDRRAPRARAAHVHVCTASRAPWRSAARRRGAGPGRRRARGPRTTREAGCPVRIVERAPSEKFLRKFDDYFGINFITSDNTMRPTMAMPNAVPPQTTFAMKSSDPGNKSLKNSNASSSGPRTSRG